MIFIGIDPGKKGWIFAIDENGKELLSKPMPLRDNGLVKGGDIFDIIISIIEEFPMDMDEIEDEEIDYFVYIEDVHSRGIWGAQKNFNFGRNVEAIHTALECLGVKYETVIPTVWQKELWKGTKPLLDEKGKIDTKSTSILVAMDLFPEIDLRKTSRSKEPFDGKVDSLLIAEYGRRQFFKNQNTI